ncbi:hypothetical protein [Paenibacillus xanthanilyticus]|uniref:Uncharacterized protein n=1 Tax=Paenibacillus xanthanilyticus TaxID=1783531 RepID=A0ABV8JXW6_9BACL
MNRGELMKEHPDRRSEAGDRAAAYTGDGRTAAQSESARAAGKTLPSMSVMQARLLGWQRSLGNSLTREIVQRMPLPAIATAEQAGPSSFLRGFSATGEKKVVQRVLSQIQIDKDRHSETNPNNIVIEDVLIAGRTPSPFPSTMGAHSTAWVAHIDAVRRHLIGYQLSQACDYLIDYAEHQRASPLLRLKSRLAAEHRKKLEEADTALQSAVIDAQTYTDEASITDAHAVIVQLQKLIRTLLTFVNYLPMATVAGGDPGGNGEGKARELLNLYESAASTNELLEDARSGKHSAENDEMLAEDDEQKQQDIQRYAESIQDYENVLADIRRQNKAVNLTQQQSLKTKVRSKLRKLFAAETPGVFSQSRIRDPRPKALYETWALGLQHFLDTVRLAYPYSYEFAEWQDGQQLLEEIRLLLVEEQSAKEVVTHFKLMNASTDAHNYIFDLLRGKRQFETLGEDGAAALEDVLGKAPAPSADAIGPSDYSSENSGTFMSMIFLNEDGLIGDVLIKGRTNSPFASSEGMGAHSTAWTAHVDAVRRSMTSRSLEDAEFALDGLAWEALSSPAYTMLGDQVGGKQIQMLTEASAELRRLTDLEVDYSQTNDGIKHLQELIFAYLNFVNVTPLSTVVTGGVPGGRNEGRHRQLLLSFEENEPPVTAELKVRLQEALFGLFDPGSVDKFAPDEDKRGGDIEQLDTHKWYYALNTLVHTLETAYPKAFEAADFHEFLYGKFHEQAVVRMEEEESGVSRKEQEKENKKDLDVQLNELQDRHWLADMVRAKGWKIGQKVRVGGRIGIICGRLNEKTRMVKVQFLPEDGTYMQLNDMDWYSIDEVEPISES